jgi:hypothetical protein
MILNWLRRAFGTKVTAREKGALMMAEIMCRKSMLVDQGALATLLAKVTMMEEES